MSNTLKTSWYAKIRGQTIGPLSQRELDELSLAGALRNGAEISQDGLQWKPAGGVSPVIATVPSARQPCQTWFHVLLVGVGFLGGLAVMAVLVVIVGMSQNTQSPPLASSVVASADATSAYWESVVRIIAVANSAQTMDLANGERAAAELQAIPIEGVDIEAIAAVENLVATIRQIVATSQRQPIPIDPLMQRPAGRSEEDGIDTERWAPVENNVRAVQAQLESTRAALSQRYRREFTKVVF